MADARLQLGRQAYQYYLDRGLAPHQAAALAGNFAWESGGKTDNINPYDNRKMAAAPHSFGIGQWNGDRLVGLIDYARKNGADIPAGDLRDQNYIRSIAPKLPLDTQLGYAWQEMQGPEKRAFDTLKGGTDLRSANAGAISFYRPAGWSWENPTAGHGFMGRYGLADTIMRSGPKSVATEAPAAPYDMYGEAARPAPAATPAPAIAPSVVAAAPPTPEKTPASFFGGLLGLGDTKAPTIGGMSLQGDPRVASAMATAAAAPIEQPAFGLSIPRQQQAPMQQAAPQRLGTQPRNYFGLMG